MDAVQGICPLDLDCTRASLCHHLDLDVLGNSFPRLVVEGHHLGLPHTLPTLPQPFAGIDTVHVPLPCNRTTTFLAPLGREAERSGCSSKHSIQVRSLLGGRGTVRAALALEEAGALSASEVALPRPGGHLSDHESSREHYSEQTPQGPSRSVLGPPQHGAMDSYLFAHTNPVFVIADGQPIRSREDAAFFVDWIEETLEDMGGMDRWDDPAHRAEVFATFEEALRAQDLVQLRLERPAAE